MIVLSSRLSLFLGLALLAGSAAGQATKPFTPPVAASAAVTTGSGLVYQSLREGKGPSPQATDSVTVNYRGTLLDGREFDSSYKRNAPATFPLDRVIKCWTEGLQRMKVGGKARLVCPAAIAYGDRGAGPLIAAGATLQFEVELLAIAGK